MGMARDDGNYPRERHPVAPVMHQMRIWAINEVQNWIMLQLLPECPTCHPPLSPGSPHTPLFPDQPKASTPRFEMIEGEIARYARKWMHSGEVFISINVEDLHEIMGHSAATFEIASRLEEAQS